MRIKKRNYAFELAFQGICLFAVILPLAILFLLLGQVVLDGASRIDWAFISGFPSRKPELAGIFPALVGTLFLAAISGLIGLPIGVSAAIYLEEYAKSSRLASLIEANVSNLAGVPSVIYGLLGLEIFVRVIGLGHSVLAGGATMALLMLPVVITSSREALRTVPRHYRESGYALGATRFQMVWQIILPMAYPGILTGAILALSRVIGETAPLIVVGAATYMAFVPDSLTSEFTTLPIQIFNWVSRPQKGFMIDAAAGIVVLVVTLLLLNGISIYLRNRLDKQKAV